MIFTSSSANKYIKTLQEKINSLTVKEDRNMKSRYLAGEEAIATDYDFIATQQQRWELNGKIARIRHAINVFNTTTMLPGFDFTIDEALVRMAMLSEMKQHYSRMKNESPLDRRSLSNGTVEFTKCNYDIADANTLFERISEELTAIQLALDSVNLTGQIEIDI